jgi:probable rRNA maturation factor
VKISITTEVKLEDGRIFRETLKGVIKTVLTAEQTELNSEVSLLITSQQKVHDLNRTYLGEDRPTDVLSFPMLPPYQENPGFITPPDGFKHLGEVIISLPQAITQAAEHGHTMEREITILTIHGVLHLLGYDHGEPEEEARMKAREVEILSRIEKNKASTNRIKIEEK